MYREGDRFVPVDSVRVYDGDDGAKSLASILSELHKRIAELEERADHEDTYRREQSERR